MGRGSWEAREEERLARETLSVSEAAGVRHGHARGPGSERRELLLVDGIVVYVLVVEINKSKK